MPRRNSADHRKVISSSRLYTSELPQKLRRYGGENCLPISALLRWRTAARGERLPVQSQCLGVHGPMVTILPRRLPILVALIGLFLSTDHASRQADAQGSATERPAKRPSVDDAIKQLSSGTSAADDPDGAKRSGPKKRISPRQKAAAAKGDAPIDDSPNPAADGGASNSLPVSTAPSSEQKQDLGATARDMAGGVFLLGGKVGTGSAWVISKKHRLLVTNAHVADIRHKSGGKMVAVQNGTSTFYDVEKVWYHPGVRRFLKGHRLSVRSADPEEGDTDAYAPDLAIMQLSMAGPDLTTEFTPASLDELNSIFAQPVAIMGFPGHDTHGLPEQGETAAATFHSGVVSRITDFQFNNGTPAAEHQFVQYTMSTWGGYSGSAVFLPSGRVVAVHNSSTFDRRGDEVRSIPHGIRVDSVLEMLVFHKLDGLVPFAIDKSALQIKRWTEPDARTEKAHADLAKAAELVDQSNALWEQGDRIAAAKKCEEALDVVPTYAPAFSTRAGIFYSAWIKSNDWPTERAMTVLNQALSDATRANQLTPGLEIMLQMCRVRNAMTWETEDSSHSEKVLAFLTPLLENDKALDDLSRASVLQVRGNSYNLIDQNDKALADFNECVRLDPQNPARYDARGRYFESVKRPGDASADFLYADKLRGEGVQVYWQGQWYPAEILKTSGNRYFIHYKGYEASWDEWVVPARVRVNK